MNSNFLILEFRLQNGTLINTHVPFVLNKKRILKKISCEIYELNIWINKKIHLYYVFKHTRVRFSVFTLLFYIFRLSLLRSLRKHWQSVTICVVSISRSIFKTTLSHVTNYGFCTRSCRLITAQINRTRFSAGRA